MGKFTPYKVQLASLRDGHYEQDFVIDTTFFKNMENTDVMSADVHVHMEMEKRNDVYDCTFRCRGTLEIPCDRCLEPLQHEVDTTYHIVVMYGDSYDDASDDTLVIPYSDASLNVAYLLYDTVLLTIPMRHVHPPGKCNKAMAAVLDRHGAGTADDEVADAMDRIDADPDADDIVD